MKIYKNISLATAKRAKGHKHKGMSIIADEKSLELFKKHIPEDLAATVDHGESIVSGLGAVAYVDKDSIKLNGKQLVGDVIVPNSSYSKDKLFIGEWIENLAKNDPQHLNLSFEVPEVDMDYEINPISGEAAMRPKGDVRCTSFVKTGAITDNYYAFRKLAAERINNLKLEDTKMTEDIKKAEVKAEDIIPADTKENTVAESKLVASARKLAAIQGSDSVNPMSGGVSDESKDEPDMAAHTPEMSPHEAAIHAKLDSILVALGTQKDTIESLKQSSTNPASGNITTNLSAKKEEVAEEKKVVAVVKYSADVKVVDEDKKNEVVDYYKKPALPAGYVDLVKQNAGLFLGREYK